MKEKLKEFFKNKNYDIRKRGDARWIDQKCACDVLSIIADCILEYVGDEGEKEFTVSDIWHNDYTRENVVQIFSKPDPELKAQNEYDKYFGQPIKLFSYSGLLDSVKIGNKYFYKIKDFELLKYISIRPMNAIYFLNEYIKKVLKDSEIYDKFEIFFEKQDNTSYSELRKKFIDFTIENTKINKEKECGRIFIKVLNPLAFSKRKKGTEKGYISKGIIKFSDIQYNRVNWRDELSGKEKDKTRIESESDISKKIALINYTVNKAKKNMRNYNDKIYFGESEVFDENERVKATQVHHIFPQSEFPKIADYLENLIVLTPNQHFSMAHPDNKTRYIDRDFQYICLISKFSKIFESLVLRKEDFYDFNNYKEVLNIGLETREFTCIEDNDFFEIMNKIDIFYDENRKNNKYMNLLKKNYPKLN
jgi:hypothetical protein